MNEHDAAEGEAAQAFAELAGLKSQAETVRAVLVKLLQDVVVAETMLENSRGAQLLEANERLVLSALAHQAEAETASQALNEVVHSAESDPLTDLPNRVLFRDRLAQAVVDAKRHGTSLAVLFLDLNNFKQINDALGHAIGDKVLRRVGACLTASVREADTVSRYGGDEFLVLLPQVGQAVDAIRIAEKAIAALASPCQLGGHVLRLYASIGISVYPADGQSVDELIDVADSSMYQAKTRGPGSYAFHAGTADPETSSPRKALQPPYADLSSTVLQHELHYAQLRETNEQLLLSALNAKDLAAAAEAANRRQADFLAMIAHELRNPLAPIRLATAMLGRLKTDEPLLPRAQGLIDRQVAQMARLVDDLLDVSRSHTGKLHIQFAPVDALQVIDDAILMVRPAMDIRLQSLDIRLPSPPLMVQGDAGRLVQVLQNLLNNASKFTPDKGAIRIEAWVRDETLEMVVSDQGIGIAPELLPHIFEPFVQDSHVIAIREVGLGVGLTVARQLVLAHGGTLEASSPGRGLGCRFVVHLPLRQSVGASTGTEPRKK